MAKTPGSHPGGDELNSQDKTKLTEAIFDQDVDVATLNTFCLRKTIIFFQLWKQTHIS